MKLIRQFFRYIRDGFKNIWNNLFMSLSSVITLTLTLSLCSLFVLFAHNTSNFTEQVESEIKIFVEFSKEATQEQIAAAIDLMKSQEHVADIIHTTKEEEYTDFINRIGEDDPELATFFENTSENQKKKLRHLNFFYLITIRYRQTSQPLRIQFEFLEDQSRVFLVLDDVGEIDVFLVFRLLLELDVLQEL